MCKGFYLAKPVSDDYTENQMEETSMARFLELWKNQKLRAVCCGLLLGLVCQLHLAPFAYYSYVVSMGTPVLNILLLFQPQIPVPLLTGVMTGVACLLRGILGLQAGAANFWEKAVPALYYYVSYSILLSISLLWLRTRGKGRRMVAMIFCDFVANTLQLTLLGHLEAIAVWDAALVSLVRGVLVWMLYWMCGWEQLYIRKKEHQQHYAQLCGLVSDIYAEAFYLKKSMGDLNGLTSRSHQLYEQLGVDKPEGQAALEIAREAHEVHKDYQRIVQGISSLVKQYEQESLRLSYILRIIEDNVRRQMRERKLGTELQVSCRTDLQIKSYYDIFTILNNLLSNSLDACGGKGKIELLAERRQDDICLIVEDNGCGIDPDTLEYIWGAGFSTKYSHETGKMSAGIGLCHVKNLIEHLQGKIILDSVPGKGTRFEIRIPVKGLQISGKGGTDETFNHDCG